MFDIQIIKNGQELPEQDFAIFMAADGIYKKQKNLLGYGIGKLPKEMLATLDLKEVKPTFTVTAPKIPGELWAELVKFYTLVYAKHQSEAAVLLLFNPDTKDWDILVPAQTVTGAHASYNLQDILQHDDRLTTGGYNIVGTSHSHGSMNAFFSGTDDADELKFDGIHITVGKVNTTAPTYAASVVFSGERYRCDIGELVDILPPAEPDPKMDSWIGQVKKQAVQTTQVTTPSTYSGYNGGYGGGSYGASALKSLTPAEKEKLSKTMHNGRPVWYEKWQNDIDKFYSDYKWDPARSGYVLQEWAKTQTQTTVVTNPASTAALPSSGVKGNGGIIPQDVEGQWRHGRFVPNK